MGTRQDQPAQKDGAVGLLISCSSPAVTHPRISPRNSPNERPKTRRAQVASIWSTALNRNGAASLAGTCMLNTASILISANNLLQSTNLLRPTSASHRSLIFATIAKPAEYGCRILQPAWESSVRVFTVWNVVPWA